MRRSRTPLFGLVGLCMTIGSVSSSLLASERFDEVAVTTWPAGARVIVDGREGGCTPLVLSLSREVVHVVTVELEGYLPRTAEVRPEVDWSELSKGLLGGSLGAMVQGTVDLATGEAERLAPAEIEWTLERLHDVGDRVGETLLPIVASGLSRM